MALRKHPLSGDPKTVSELKEVIEKLVHRVLTEEAAKPAPHVKLRTPAPPAPTNGLDSEIEARAEYLPQHTELARRMLPGPLMLTWKALVKRQAATVFDLMDDTGMKRKTVETHLWHLRHLGLVERRPLKPRGRTRHPRPKTR